MKLLPEGESTLVSCAGQPHIRARMWTQFWTMAQDHSLDQIETESLALIDPTVGLGRQLGHFAECPDCLSAFSDYWITGTMTRECRVLEQVRAMTICQLTLAHCLADGCGHGLLSTVMVELAQFGHPLALTHIRGCRACSQLQKQKHRRAIAQMLSC